MQSTNLVDVNSLIDEQPSKTVDVNSLIEQPQKKNSLQHSPASSAPSVQSTLPSVPQSVLVESNPPVDNKPLITTDWNSFGKDADNFVLTHDGVKIPLNNTVVPKDAIPSLVTNLQQKINTKSATQDDINIIAQASGKKPAVVQAYIKDGAVKGAAIENNDYVDEQRQKVSDYISSYNRINGTQYDPQEVMSSADKLNDFLNASKKENTRLSKEVRIGGKLDLSKPLTPKQSEQFAFLNYGVVPIRNEMINQIVQKTVQELPKDKAIDKIASVLNPTDYQKVKDMQKEGWGIKDFLTAAPTPLSVFKSDYKEQGELFNYQKGIAELKYNDALRQNALNKISKGTVDGNEELVNEGHSDLSNVDENVISKYPALQKQRIAQEVNDYIAKKSGVVKGYDAETFNDYKEKVFGSSTQDRLDAMRALGILDDPKQKDIAESMASNSTYFANNSILGGAVPSFLQPIGELGYSIGDITGLRSKSDVFADKIKDQLFPKDFTGNNTNDPNQLQLKSVVQHSKTAVNTTFNLAGMMAIATVTEGVGTELGVSRSVAQKLGAYTSFGLPAFDESLKNHPESITSEPAKYLYAAINSIANAEGGRVLDLGKITRIPGVSEVFAEAANKISTKSITEQGLRELLNSGKAKYVDFAMKYGKNVTKGAATMAYFTTANNVVRMAFGDKDAEANLLPQAGHAFVDGLLGMSVMGAFGAVSDMRREKNTTFKNNIYNLALNHDAAADILKTGLDNGMYTKPQYDEKMQILNTARAAKNSLDAATIETGINLDANQKAVYVANKTAQKVFENKAAQEGIPEATKNKYLEQAKRLSEQSTQTLDGLKYTPTLQPLYELYNAEKEFDAAKENYNPADKASSDALEAAKSVYDKLYSDYLADNSAMPIKEDNVKNEATSTSNNVSVIKPKTQEEINNQIPTVTIAPKENTPETKQGVSVVLPQTVERGREMPTVTVDGKTNENATEKTTEVPKSTEAASTTNETANKIEQPAAEELVKRVEEKGVSGYKKTSIGEVGQQALQAPNSLKNQLGGDENLVTDLIAHHSEKQINDAIKEQQDGLGNNPTDQDITDVDNHIRLLEKGLEKRQSTAPAVTEVKQNDQNTTTPTAVSSPISENKTEPQRQGSEGNVSENTRPTKRGNAETSTTVLEGKEKPISVNEGGQKTQELNVVKNINAEDKYKGLSNSERNGVKFAEALPEIMKDALDKQKPFRDAFLKRNFLTYEEFKNLPQESKDKIQSDWVKSKEFKDMNDALDGKNPVPENKAPKEKPISKPISEVKEKSSKPTNTKESNFSKKLKDKYKDFNLGGTKSAEKVDTKFEGEIKTDNGKQPIEQYVSRAKEVLNKLFPDATFETYKTTDEYVKAGGAKSSRGMFDSKADGTKRLLLNLEQMKEDGIGKTAFHEAIHPIVDEVVGAHPEELNPLWNDLYREMQGVKGFEKVVEHVELYKQDERPAAEGLTELLTQIAEGNISLEDVPPARKGIIVDLLNKLFEKLGLNIRFGESYDFKDFATDIKKAFETGDVEALKNVVDERAEANKRAKDNAGKVNDLLFGKSADKGRFEAAASKIADSIRNADIPQWIINTSSEAKQSGFGLSGENMKEALAKSIEAVGKIMDKGVDLKEAISREVDNFIKNIKSFDGIKDLKPTFEKTLRDNFEKEALNRFNKESQDRASQVESMVKDAMDEGFETLADIKEAITNGLGIDTPAFRKMIDDAYERVKGEPESEGIVNIPSRTGITHAATAELREKYGLGNYVRDEAMTDVELQKRADDIIAEGYNPNDLVGQMENGIPPTPVENFILKRYVADLVAKFDKSKSDEDFNDLDRVMKAVETIGTLQSHSFRTRGGLVDISETLPGFIRAEVELNKNAPLTDGQKKKVEQEYDNIQTANADYEAKIAALEAENAALKEVKNRKANKKSSTRKTHEDFVKERQDAVAGAREALRKLRTGESGLSSVPLPGVRELVAIAPHVKKALASLVEEGSYKLADYVKELHGQFKDVLEGITEKDINNIIAGKYDEKKATRSELAARMVDLKTEANLVNRLEDLLKGEEPKDEKRKIKRNQAIESLRSKIKQAESFKRGYEKEVEQGKKEPVPDELKRLRAVKLGIERNLRKVQEDIDNGNFSPAQKATSILDNPEVRKQFPEEYKATVEAKDKLIKAKNERHLRLLRQQQENMSDREKAIKGVAEVLNIPRALMTMLDYSAMLRQAVIPTIAHPSLAGKSLVEMIKVGASQKRYDRWFYDLVETPRYKLMELSKLAITDSTSPLLTAREESFMSNLAEKIPVIGKTLNVGKVKIPGTNLVKGSERAYTMYLNKMRVDLFNRFADAMEERGLTFENSPKAYKQMANYVNNATGRGDLGAKLDRVAPILNSLFFSPRLIASRINMLTYLAQPRFYRSVPREVRVAYFKDMTKFLGLGLTVLGLFSINKDDETVVEIDPRSSDFGKVRNKNTRWDIWGGFQQYVRVVAQIWTGKRKSTTGKIYTLDGEGAFGQTTNDVLVSFGRGKLAPVPGMAVDLLSRRTIVGEKIKFQTGNEGYKEINIGRYAKEHLLPLNFTGLQEALKDQGAKAWFTVGVPSTFGIGTQTFDNQKRPKKSKIKYSY